MSLNKVENIQVITVDGPSGTGKGTLSQMLAKHLGYHLLDSGALYRLLALAVLNHGVDLDNEEGILVLAEHLDVQFLSGGEEGTETQIILEGENVSLIIRTEEIGAKASIIAAIPSVRAALLHRQQVFKDAPGLVADGRDMGTEVFPEAKTKVFLTASAEERANRRYKQLKEKGQDASLADLARTICERDERDSNRAVSPLKPADDAVTIDTTTMPIDEVFLAVLSLHEKAMSVELTERKAENSVD